jgi:hypothetical protein
MNEIELSYNRYIKKLLNNNADAILLTNKYKSAIALVDILESEIESFKYEEENDIEYLNKIFGILNKLIDGNETLLDTLYNRFTYIHNCMRITLHYHPENMDDNALDRFRTLQKIMDKMENTLLQLYLNNPTEYDYDKEAFIEYVIFKLKYENIVRDAVEKFPYIVNSIDNNGVSLIEKVLDKYLSSLDEYLSLENLGHIDDLIYYSKVLKIIMSSNKVKIDDYSIKYMLSTIMEFYKSKNYTQNRHKEKLSFFINDCINILTGEKEEETLDYLNYKYEIHSKFKEAHNLEAKRIYIDNKKELVKTTNRKIYTFDGKGAFELDDGLSCTYEDGIYHLGVHIADPNSYIDINNILMDEATRRTTSLYMGNECIPLFPFILSGDTMSLNVNKKTWCMSYYYDIDAITGDLINFNIKNEICEITGNLTYQQFDEYLNKGTSDSELFNTLVNLSNISSILKRIYNKQITFEEFNNTNQSESTKVVESAMIYTNYQTAKYFDKNDLPFMYRCHEKTNDDVYILNKIEENLRNKNQSQDIINEINKYKELMQKAYYTRHNIGHYGLGIKYYSHVTSPLRRLADVINSICIKKFYINKNFTKDDIKEMIDLIDEISEQINNKRNSCVDYEIQYLRLKNRV